MTLRFFCCTVVILLFLPACLDPITHRNNPEIIRWKGMKEDSAQYLLSKKVPLQTSAEDVIRFCKKQSLSPSKLTANKNGFFITASSPIIGEKVMTNAKWLLKFHFNQSKQLIKIELHKSLIGF